MLYAVIDTNVLVSALLGLRKNAPTNPWKVMNYIFSGDVIPVFNDDILQEYRDVLGRQKFHFDQKVVEKMVSEIKRIGISQEAIATNESFPDPDDAVFFEVAMANKQEHEESYLVTGNTKHFPVSPIVTTPAQFVSIMEALSRKNNEESQHEE